MCVCIVFRAGIKNIYYEAHGAFDYVYGLRLRRYALPQNFSTKKCKSFAKGGWGA